MSDTWGTIDTAVMSEGSLRDCLWSLFVQGLNVRPQTPQERAVCNDWMRQGLVYRTKNRFGKACFARTGRCG